MSEPSTQPPAPVWDVNRPLLSSLLARREELRAPMVVLSAGQARFNGEMPAAGPGIPARAPDSTVEPFDTAGLLDEHMTQTDMVMGALRDEPFEFRVPVHTWVQTMVPIVMPEEGIEVVLRGQVSWAPLTVHLHMPLTLDDRLLG